MTQYRLHPDAMKELVEKRKLIARSLGAHLITVEQAKEQAWLAFKQLAAQAMVEVPDGTDAVPIICNGCGEVTVVASDVLRYTCKCSPGVEQFTFQSRRLDLPIGTGNIEDYMAANKGRQSLDLSV